MTFLATLLHKNYCPRGHESYNFGRPFFGYHFCELNLSDVGLGVEKKIFFKEIHQFYTLYPRITSIWDGGHEIYNFVSLYPIDATYQI